MPAFWTLILVIAVSSAVVSTIGIVLWAKGKTKMQRYFGIVLDIIGGCVLLIPFAIHDLTDKQDGIAYILAIIIALPEMLIPASISNSRNKKRELMYLRSIIVKTKFIDSSHTVTQQSRVSTGDALGRAIIGDFIAGPIGAIIGSTTAKETVTTNEKHTTTFMIYYKDGTRQHQTVDNGTVLYNLYMEKLDLD